MAQQVGRQPNHSDADLPGLRLALTVGILGVMATGVLFTWLWLHADGDADAQLETQLASVVQSSEAALDQVAERLNSLNGLFRASVEVTAEEFRTFTDDIGLAPGMSGIGYVARVDAAELDDFEEFLQARHDESVGLYEIDEDGNLQPLSLRRQYFLLQDVTPGQGWEPLVGYDLGSSPQIASTIGRAVQTGELMATHFFDLGQGTEGGYMMMIEPVIDPDSGEADAIVGALMSFGELIEANIPVGVAPHVDVDFAEEAGPVDTEGVSAQLEYAGRIWTIAIAPLSGSPFAADRSGAYAVLVVGLLASGLAVLLVILMQQRVRASTALAAAAQARDTKDRFIASVSHELRTPLTAVLGFAEILKGTGDLTTEERMAMMKAITEEATDLAHLIDDLLVAARGEIGQIFVAEATVSLRKEVEGVAAASGIGDRLHVMPSGGANEMAIADPIRVRQILRNLVENARRYGGSEIEVELRPGDIKVSVEVRDNGPGIPAEVGDRVFSPYERFGGTVGVTESLGLGLAVSTQLAALMGGELRHERRENWTVFSLTLPATTANDPDRAGEPAASS